MGLYFLGGERVQRGRGIGGILRIATKLFSPVSSLAKNALKSNAGRRIVNAVKEQAVDSTANIIKDIAGGKNLKESFKDEFENVKKNAKRKAIDVGIEMLNGEQSKKKKEPKQKLNRNRRKSRRKKRDIFD